MRFSPKKPTPVSRLKSQANLAEKKTRFIHFRQVRLLAKDHISRLYSRKLKKMIDPPALMAMVVPATIPMAAMPLLRGVGTGTGAGYRAVEGMLLGCTTVV